MTAYAEFKIILVRYIVEQSNNVEVKKYGRKWLPQLFEYGFIYLRKRGIAC
mgnify:CR=1 FL=1